MCNFWLRIQCEWLSMLSLIFIGKIFFYMLFILIFIWFNLILWFYLLIWNYIKLKWETFTCVCDKIFVAGTVLTHCISITNYLLLFLIVSYTIERLWLILIWFLFFTVGLCERFLGYYILTDLNLPDVNIPCIVQRVTSL